MTEILAVIIAVVLGLLGIERYKNNKKDRTIKAQALAIDQGKKQDEIFQVALDLPGKVSQETDRINQDQRVRDQEIQEAGTDEEIIQIAQNIIDNFNRSSRN